MVVVISETSMEMDVANIQICSTNTYTNMVISEDAPECCVRLAVHGVDLLPSPKLERPNFTQSWILYSVAGMLVGLLRLCTCADDI
jgi:hypothetical protein